jgi:hypothetical protein
MCEGSRGGDRTQRSLADELQQFRHPSTARDAESKEGVCIMYHTSSIAWVRRSQDLWLSDKSMFELNKVSCGIVTIKSMSITSGTSFSVASFFQSEPFFRQHGRRSKRRDGQWCTPDYSQIRRGIDGRVKKNDPYKQHSMGSAFAGHAGSCAYDVTRACEATVVNVQM